MDLPGSVESRLTMLASYSEALAQDERLPYSARKWCESVESGAETRLMEFMEGKEINGQD